MRISVAPFEVLFVHASADLYGSDITLLQLVSGLARNEFRATVVVPYDGPLVARLRDAGADAVLVGEAAMRDPTLVAKLSALP